MEKPPDCPGKHGEEGGKSGRSMQRFAECNQNVVKLDNIEGSSHEGDHRGGDG
jgi:hypothetical protein